MALSLSNVFLQRTFLHPLLPTRKTPTPTTKPYKRPQCNCKKRDIHPTFYEDAKVYCNGEHVLTVGGTSKEYVVDVWSGNHPFYLGTQSTAPLYDDQLTKFRRKYGDSTFTDNPVLKEEIIIHPKPEGAAKDGNKK